jgi:hypothetical protein
MEGVFEIEMEMEAVVLISTPLPPPLHNCRGMSTAVAAAQADSCCGRSTAVDAMPSDSCWGRSTAVDAMPSDSSWGRSTAVDFYATRQLLEKEYNCRCHTSRQQLGK